MWLLGKFAKCLEDHGINLAEHERGSLLKRTIKILFQESNIHNAFIAIDLFEHSQLIRLTSVYVNDLLQCGTNQLLQQAVLTVQNFESKNLEIDSALFAGVRVRLTDNGYSLNQKHYDRRLRVLLKDYTFSYFRSSRHKLV